jgi:hypothetical protein
MPIAVSALLSRTSQPWCAASQSARLRRARLVDGEGEREGDHGGDQPAELAAIGPDGAHGHAGARRRPGAVEIAHQMAKIGGRVAFGELEAAQPRLDRAAVGADESVDARARRLVEQRVGQARALGLDVVARRAFFLQPSHQLVMALGGGGGGAQRIGAGVGGFVGERGVIDAVAVAFERGEGGRSDGAGRIARHARGVDRGDHDLRQEGRARSPSGGGGERFDVLDPATQREARARAGRPDESDLERRLGVGGERDLGQRPRRLGGAHQVGGGVGSVGVDKRLAARGGRRGLDGDRRRLDRDRRRRVDGRRVICARAAFGEEPRQPVVNLAIAHDILRRLAAARRRSDRPPGRATIWPRARRWSRAISARGGEQPDGRQASALRRGPPASSRRACAALASFGSFSAMP